MYQLLHNTYISKTTQKATSIQEMNEESSFQPRPHSTHKEYRKNKNTYTLKNSTLKMGGGDVPHFF